MQEVNTRRVRRSGVPVTSPALLFSYSQWNKKVLTPEDRRKQNCFLRRAGSQSVMEAVHTLTNTVLKCGFKRYF